MATADVSLPLRTRVRIQGLKSSAQLNGATGSVATERLANGRYGVDVDGTSDTSKKRVALKPVNIVMLRADELERLKQGSNMKPKGASPKHPSKVSAAAKTRKASGDTTCWICLEGAADGCNEPLMRDCACRGSAGYAHVSCLIEAATLQDEQLRQRARTGETWQDKWECCGICLQRFYGDVNHELAMARYNLYKDHPIPLDENGIPIASSPDATEDVKNDVREKEGAYSHLASAYMSDGNFELALPLLETNFSLVKPQVEYCERRGQPISSDAREIYAEKAHSLGLCKIKLGRSDEAMMHLERGLQVLEAGQPETGRETAEGSACLFDIAQIHAMGGNPKKANEILGEVMKIREKVFGKDSKEYLRTVFNWLGTSIGHTKKTIAVARENADRCFRLLGPDDPLTKQFRQLLDMIGVASNDDERNNEDSSCGTIKGLTRRMDLNGKRVQIAGSRISDDLDLTTLRYETRIGGEKNILSLKPTNVILDENTQAQIFGLASEGGRKYNKKRCVIVSYNEEKARYQVRLFHGKTVQFMLKPENCVAGCGLKIVKKEETN
mmetsp:Transcript_24832/g.50935  ORF Transcript_24832/g.50935 Transcript_24832/m.50935 type:complete len:556 (-) Transcript_24832:143-1810(-)|eukprot:CAMPEP_0178687304 /NCGR_PEP_ID=MMETSP0699-20121125/4384_1 /TAXON_ID=265572 /ORGANISM="Extubocellulus spinifer, Strain CCMP396" /LENGTH=555 /DNA_ID=CAMNT_0020332193 /DNA_START=40 /DNA_END=1707 /DNA_ORIENTATION=+